MSGPFDCFGTVYRINSRFGQDFATWIHINRLQASIFSLGVGYNEFMQVH